MRIILDHILYGIKNGTIKVVEEKNSGVCYRTKKEFTRTSLYLLKPSGDRERISKSTYQTIQKELSEINAIVGRGTDTSLGIS